MSEGQTLLQGERVRCSFSFEKKSIQVTRNEGMREGKEFIE